MNPARVLVCGGRKYNNSRAFCDALDKVFLDDPRDNVTIISGGAPGADTLAYEWADCQQVKQEIYPALWSKYGRSAGPIRNQQMLDTGIDLVVAFPGGSGTADMVRRARKAGVPVIEVQDG